MIARATADEIHITRGFYGLQDAGHIRVMRQQVQQLACHLGLLVDFLEHKVGIAAFLHRGHFLGDQLWLAFNPAAVTHRVQFYAIPAQGDHVAIIEAHNLARQWQDRGQIRGDAGKAIANPYH
jgi:hypothetical protein